MDSESSSTRALAVAVLALGLPVSALSDMTGTTTLPANSTYSLDAGATPGCTADIGWNGTSIDPGGTATLYLVPGAGGSTEFDSLTLAILKTVSYTPIGITNVAVNDVFAVKTNAGNYAKVLVTAINGTSVTLRFDTFGVTAGAPVIYKVMNNYSYSSVARGSLFVIAGCGLATPGSQAVLQDATKGLPLTLNGVSVSVTVSGVTTQPGFYYATATQLAAVLPSATPAGSGTVSVTYNGQTSSTQLGVWETAFGFGTYYGTGTGQALATDAGYQPLTPTHAASPGQTITFWGSGLGASMADSDTAYTTTPHGISVPQLPLQVLVGGVSATVSYQGRSGYPGLNQVNVTIPQDVPPGCAVSVVAVNSNYQVISNFVTLPIAVGGGACADPIMEVSAAQAGSLSGKGVVNVGLLAIEQSNPGPVFGAAVAGFFTMPGSSLGAWMAGPYTGLSPQVSLGSCVEGVGVGPSMFVLLPQLSLLDAGTMTVTGPGGTRPLPELAGPPAYYLANLGIQDGLWNPLTGGAFTFAAGGGKDVGAFTATLNFPIQETFTNIQSGSPSMAIYRGGQTVTWTGGTAGEFVTVSGSNGYAGFTCNAAATDGQFTIPPSVLVPLATTGSSGTLSVRVATYPQPVTAPGLDVAYIFGFAVPLWVNVTYY